MAQDKKEKKKKSSIKNTLKVIGRETKERSRLLLFGKKPDSKYATPMNQNKLLTWLVYVFVFGLLLEIIIGFF